MPTVSYEHLYGLAVAIYEAAGASTETAQTVARHSGRSKSRRPRLPRDTAAAD